MRYNGVALALLLAMLFAANIADALLPLEPTSSPTMPTTPTVPMKAYSTKSPQIASYLEDNVVSFLTNVPAGHSRTVLFSIATNQQNGEVTYINGAFQPTKNASLIGLGTRLYSNRIAISEDMDKCTCPLNPFNINQPDSVKLSFNLNDGSGSISWWSGAKSPVVLKPNIYNPVLDNSTKCITGLIDKQMPFIMSFQYKDTQTPS